MRAAARAAGEDIIDLGMGNPDLPPPQHVIDKLLRSRDEARRARLFAVQGHSRASAARRRIITSAASASSVDPESEVVVTMGSKEGLASLATAITAPGDVVLAPNPSYPIHTFGFIIAGATIRCGADDARRALFRALDRAMAFTVPRPIGAGGQLSVEPDRRRRSTSRSTSGWSRGRRRTRSGSCRTSPIRSSITTATRRPRSCRSRARRTSRSSSPRCRKTYSMAGLADRLRGRQQDADRGDDAGEILPRLRRVHADPGGRLRRAQRPAGHRREEPRSSTTSAATCWSRASAAPAGTSRRPARRCSPGRRCRPRSRIWAASSSPSSC